MASFIYNEAKKQILEGTILWTSQTFKAMLVTSAYTANPDHTAVSSASSAELSGSGYVDGFAGAGRVTLTGNAIVKDNATDRAYIDCDNPAWVGIDAGVLAALVIIQEVTNDADSKLIAYLQLSTPITTAGFDITIKIPTSGWAFI
jgi:hypothetical protein